MRTTVAHRDLLEHEITVNGQPWRIRWSEVLVDEWCEVEELSGMDAGELTARFFAGGMRARKAVLYLARKRGGAAVPWDSPELNPRAGDMLVRDVTPRTSAAEDTPEPPDPLVPSDESRSPTT